MEFQNYLNSKILIGISILLGLTLS